MLCRIRPTYNKALRLIIFIVMLWCTASALTIQPIIEEPTGPAMSRLTRLIMTICGESGTVSPSHVLSLSAAAYLYKKTLFRADRPFCLTAFILSCIFALFRLIGFSFASFKSFEFIIANKKQVLISLIVLSGYISCFYSLMKLAIIKWDQVNSHRRDATPFLVWTEAHLPAVCAVVMAICWIVIWIWYFPGSVPHDAQYQLAQFYGIYPINNHHPYLSTLIMGTLVELGHSICSFQLGVFLYVCFQSILGILVFSAVCVYLRRKGISMRGVLWVLAYYAVTPVFGAHMQAVIKDTLFMIAFTWFCLLYIRIYYDGGSFYTFLRLFLAAGFVCLLRNNGIYIALPSLVILTLIKKTHWKWLAGITAMTAVLMTFHTMVLLPRLEVGPGSVREAMSLPFQCTARLVRDYGDELSEDEIETIDRILDYKSLAKQYNPELSDYVKNTYREKATREDWNAYWHLWLNKLKQHPRVYAEAIMNHMFGYLDPFYLYSGMRTFQTYNKGPLSSSKQEPVFSEYVFSASARSIGESYENLWKKMPILSFFISPASYVWGELFLIGLLLRKKQFHEAMIFIIPVLNTLICMASPVNGLLRYMIPVAAAFPLFGLVATKRFSHDHGAADVVSMQQ